MSIAEYVQSLELSQLEFCAERVEARLKTLKDGERVKLWVVSVDGMYAFATTSPVDAYLWLAEFSKIRAESKQFDRVTLDWMYEYPSQVAGWIENINDKPGAA